MSAIEPMKSYSAYFKHIGVCLLSHLILGTLFGANTVTPQNNYFLKADSLLYQKNFELARETYQQLAFDTGYTWVRYKIAFSYQVEGKDSLAMWMYREMLQQCKMAKTSDLALEHLLKAECFAAKPSRITHAELKNIKSFVANYSGIIGAYQQKRMYYLLARLMAGQYKFADALTLAKQSLSIRHYSPYTEAQTLTLMLECYYNTRDWQKIIDLGNFALVNGNEFFPRFTLLKQLGRAYSRSDMFKEAKVHLEQLPRLAEKEKQDTLMVEARIQIANNYMLHGFYNQARRNYLLAYKLVRNKKLSDNMKLFTANGLMYYYFHHNKQFEKMETIVPELLHLLKKNVPIRRKGQAISYLGFYYTHTDNCKKLINTLDEFVNTVGQESVEYSNVYMSCLNYKYVAYYQLWQQDSINHLHFLDSAHQGFKMVCEYRMENYDRLKSSISKKSYTLKLKDCFEDLIISAFDLYKITQEEGLLESIFEYIEKSKSVYFREMLGEAELLRKSGVLLMPLKQKGRLEQEILELRLALSREKEQGNFSRSYQKKINTLFNLTNKLDSLNEQLKKQPGINKYDNTFNGKALFNSVVEALDENQVMLNYFIANDLGIDRLFLVFVSGEKSYIKELSVGNQFVQEIISYRKHLEAPPDQTEGVQDFLQFVNESNQLYAKLIAPVEDEIRNKKIIVVANSYLNYIPFGTLVADKRNLKQRSYGNLNYLIKKNPITMLYSCNQILLDKKTLSQRSKFSAYSTYYAQADTLYEKLPGAERETNLIANYFKGSIFSNGRASKQTFFKSAPSSDIVHVAMHTAVDKATPAYSKLLFNGTENGVIEPLYMYELLGNAFDTRLMVVSGCNSGYGNLLYNEGVMSLARFFFFVGVDNVVVTHWAIADNSSADLMGYFYRNLSKGMAVDRAIQEAKVEYLGKSDPLRHHPYYWAGYEVIGNPIKMAKPFAFVWYVLFGAIPLALLVWQIKKVRSKNPVA